MLEIKDLNVAVEGKQILHDINLTIKDGETDVLFGPNGSGKTTLLMTIMGFPKYVVTHGKIFFNGEDVTNMPVDARARLGVGIMFQRPPVVRGVKTRDMVAAAMHERATPQAIENLANEANMTDFLNRDINYGFSGGEIKRSELLQLLAQRPKLVMLDEPESGVDLVNISLVGRLINELLQKDCPVKERSCMGLIITHTGDILDYVGARVGYVMCEGTIYCEGDPHEILRTIKEKGYQGCITCLMRGQHA
jgi:Fe-S cluster assembly ATP-binding protein